MSTNRRPGAGDPAASETAETPDGDDSTVDTAATGAPDPGADEAPDAEEGSESADVDDTTEDDDAPAERPARRTRRRSRPAVEIARPARARVPRPADVKAGVAFLGNGVRTLLARPLTSFHLVVSLTVILVTIGLMMVLSASGVEGYAKDGSAYGMFATQATFVVIGLVLFYLAMRLPIRTIRLASMPVLVVSLILLVLVLVPGVGVSGGGAQRWISLGGLTLQPSELAKLALCLWGAAVLSTRDPRASSVRELLMPLLPVSILVAFLVIIEPNQSTTMILGTIVATLLWFAGLPGRIFGAFVVLFGVVGVLLALGWQYRAARVFSFFGKTDDPLGGDYQSNQAKFALADGGVFGKGLGLGTAKWNYLPNAHNDFIFAVIGEELGLVGGGIIVGLYLLLGYVGMRIARRSVDPFLRLLSATITVLFMVQAFINIGYVVGLLPVTGIQLPILSYGGTSALTMLAMLGLLANAARHEPETVVALDGPQRKGLSRLLRLPKPERYRAPRRADSRKRVRRPAPTPAPSPRGRKWRGGTNGQGGSDGRRGWGGPPAPRSGQSARSSSGEIHYPARRARSSQPPHQRASAARDATGWSEPRVNGRRGGGDLRGRGLRGQGRDSRARGDRDRWEDRRR